MRGIGRRFAAAAACAALLGGTTSLAGASPAGAAEWSSAQLPGLAGKLFLLNVSCPSSSLCVATGSQNVIASSTNPDGGAGAWHVVYAGEGPYFSPYGPVISNRQVQGVSCPTTQLCVAVTTLGQIYSTRDPTGPGSGWKVVEVPGESGNTHLYGVSCPNASLCVAVSGRRSNRGKVFTSTDPTGGAEAWKVTDLGDSFDFRAVSCTSATLCVAAGANGEIVASTDPTGGLTAWSSIGTPAGQLLLQSISCPSGLCLTGNGAGSLLTSSNPLQLSSWSQRSDGGSVQVTGASCPSSSACIAVDVNGHIYASTNPTGGASAWSSTVVAPYSPEAEEFNPENPNGLFGASCPSPSFCVVVGSGGRIFTSSNPFAPPADPGGGVRGGNGSKRHGPRRPKTTIAKLILPRPRALEKLGHGWATIRFYANGPVRRFECRLGHRRFGRCRSPWRFQVGGQGVYAVRVRAVGSTGLRGAPALKRFFTGKRCERRRHGCFGGGGELPPKRHR